LNKAMRASACDRSAPRAWTMRFSYWAIELMISARFEQSMATVQISTIA
jgi:hypothetical protein